MAIIINDLNTIRFGNNLNHWADVIPNWNFFHDSFIKVLITFLVKKI